MSLTTQEKPLQPRIPGANRFGIRKPSGKQKVVRKFMENFSSHYDSADKQTKNEFCEGDRGMSVFISYVGKPYM